MSFFVRQQSLCGAAESAESADEVSGWTSQVINTAFVFVYVYVGEEDGEKNRCNKS